MIEGTAARFEMLMSTMCTTRGRTRSHHRRTFTSGRIAPGTAPEPSRSRSRFSVAAADCVAKFSRYRAAATPMGKATIIVIIISTIEPRSAELKPAMAGFDDGRSSRKSIDSEPAPFTTTDAMSQVSMARVIAVRPMSSHLNACSDGRARFFASGRTATGTLGGGAGAGVSTVLTGRPSGTCARCARR